MIFLLIILKTLHAAERDESNPDVQVQAFSSEVTIGGIGANILEILNMAQKSITIASDKCTNEEFLDDLLKLRKQKPILAVSIITGQDLQTENNFAKKYQDITYRAIPISSSGGKMHNKFIIVDDEIVITGSPNVTYAAYNYNIESFVSIRNQYIAELYKKYYQYIIDPTEEMGSHVCELMNTWNNIPNISLHVCLAPLSNIAEFIMQKINDAHIVNINMFLVSRAKVRNNDIISRLSEISSSGKAVTLKVDKSQYDTQQFMRTAIQRLIDSNARVFTVSKSSEKVRTRTRMIDTIPQFHDKLMLIEYEDTTKKIIIGSAGFTTNVQDNLNFENMISINDPNIYGFLLDHFRSIDDSRDGLKVMELQ